MDSKELQGDLGQLIPLTLAVVVMKAVDTLQCLQEVDHGQTQHVRRMRAFLLFILLFNVALLIKQ